MKIMHCDFDRTERQKVFVETADGNFRYQLFLDYAKGLPKELEMTPYSGNIAGGDVGPDDCLYCSLRGGGRLTPKPLSCLIKLDPDGNFIKTIGEGTIGGIHFIKITDHNTAIITDHTSSWVYEMDLDTGKIVKSWGEKGNPVDNVKDRDIYMRTRLQNGIFATEPSMSYNAGEYGAMLLFDQTEPAGPFDAPTDAGFDSEGNMYICDGYANFRVHKYDKDGNYMMSFGDKGVWDAYTDTPGKFIVPHALCVDPNDNIWVCDREKDAVHVFDKDGNVIAYCSHNMSQPSGVDTDGTYVYVVGRGGYLTIFDLDFNIVGELGFYNGNLRGHDIAADSKGNLYIFPTHANEEHQFIALKRC